MSYDFDGSSHYLRATSSAISTVPATIACWFNQDVLAADPLISIFNTSNFAGFRLAVGSTGVVRLTTSSSTTSVNTDTTATFSATTWNHACGVCTSTTSRTVYLNGANAITDTTSLTTSGLNETRIALNFSSGYYNGKIAEVGVWSTNLTSDEVASLGKGVSPILVRPQSLVLYMPLIRSTIDLVGRRSFTVNGTPAVFTHPRIYL